MRTLLAVVAAALLGLPAVASAQIYKCVGKDGTVRYVQTKPADGTCEGVKSAAPPPASGGNEQLLKFSEEVGKARDKEAEEAEKARLDAANRKAACERARTQLALVERAGRIFSMNEKGERVYKSDAEREQEIERNRKAVAENCQG